MHLSLSFYPTLSLSLYLSLAVNILMAWQMKMPNINANRTPKRILLVFSFN